eukprot:NODE_272_length_1718_cov_432.972339.p1 GENE.NODE_272_length_1718_cov_432.972339~~NODE_272_length_1718_cov_432.972339.p1  ORF type:complete len:533 (-),score=166.27 NODE_272_length_1718_cov_432.972339:119-1717(-)
MSIRHKYMGMRLQVAEAGQAQQALATMSQAPLAELKEAESRLVELSRDQQLLRKDLLELQNGILDARLLQTEVEELRASIAQANLVQRPDLDKMHEQIAGQAPELERLRMIVENLIRDGVEPATGPPEAEPGTAVQQMQAQIAELENVVQASAKQLAELEEGQPVCLQQMRSQIVEVDTVQQLVQTQIAELQGGLGGVMKQLQQDHKNLSPQIARLQEDIVGAFDQIKAVKKAARASQEQGHSERQHFANQLAVKARELDSVRGELRLVQSAACVHAAQNRLEHSKLPAKAFTAQGVEDSDPEECRAAPAVTTPEEVVASLVKHVDEWNDALRSVSEEMRDSLHVMTMRHNMLESAMTEVQSKVQSLVASAPSGAPSQPHEFAPEFVGTLQSSGWQAASSLPPQARPASNWDWPQQHRHAKGFDWTQSGLEHEENEAHQQQRPARGFDWAHSGLEQRDAEAMRARGGHQQQHHQQQHAARPGGPLGAMDSAVASGEPWGRSAARPPGQQQVPSRRQTESRRNLTFFENFFDF